MCCGPQAVNESKSTIFANDATSRSEDAVTEAGSAGRQDNEWDDRNRRNLTYGRVIFPPLTIAAAIAARHGEYWLTVGLGVSTIAGVISLQHALTKSVTQITATRVCAATLEKANRREWTRLQILGQLLVRVGELNLRAQTGQTLIAQQCSSLGSYDGVPAIRVEKFRSRLLAVLSSLGFRDASLLIVPSVQQWAAEHQVNEPNPDRAGMALFRRPDGLPLVVVISEIDDGTRQGILSWMDCAASLMRGCCWRMMCRS